MRFSDLCTDFLEDEKSRLREGSFSNMRYNLENYVLPVFGEMDSEELSEERISAGMKKMRGVKSKMGEGTLKKNLVLVKQIARFGMKKGVITPFLLDFKADFENFYKSDDENPEKKSLSADDARKIIDHAHENPLPANIGFLLSLCFGLKIGEICALRWSDIDISERKLTVSRIVQRVEDGKGASYIVEEPLGHDTSERTLELSEKMTAFLNGNFSERLDKNNIKNRFFVATDTGSPAEPRTYRRIFTRFLSEIGISHLKFSALQKFYESMRMENTSLAEKMTSSAIF